MFLMQKIFLTNIWSLRDSPTLSNKEAKHGMLMFLPLFGEGWGAAEAPNVGQKYFLHQKHKNS